MPIVWPKRGAGARGVPPARTYAVPLVTMRPPTITRNILPLLSFRCLLCCLSALLVCRVHARAERPKPDLLESEMRRMFEKQADANPRMTPEAKALLLKNFDAARKLPMTVDEITVYRNATAYRCTLTWKFDDDIRLSYAGYAFKIGHFTDAKGQEWGRPPWDGHIYVGRQYDELVFAIPKQKLTRVLYVDEIHQPTFARITPPPDGNAEKPARLSYAWNRWTSFLTPDTKKSESGLALAKGNTPVVWKDTDKPADLKSHVIDSKPLPKE
jgi:hypothetical protein